LDGRENLTDPGFPFHSSGGDHVGVRHREPVPNYSNMEDLSIRVGRNEIQNVTERDTKRQRDRPKDLDYRRRFSISDLPANLIPPPERYSRECEPLGGYAWPEHDNAPVQHVVTSDLGRHGAARSG
jgi:hypothetical protein